MIHPSRELDLNRYLMNCSDAVSKRYFVNLVGIMSPAISI